jgi:dTDP-4-amino-4,6-dideoxygalactose transaminase
MQGPRTAEFERLVAEYVGVKHAVAVNSGTSALTLALMAAGLGPGDKVIAPSYSFVATANTTVHWGGRPVFVDIGPDDYNIDPKKIEAAIDPATRAIVVVHQFGFPADMDAISAIAQRRGLIIIEDAACSLGSTYRGTHMGGFGAAGCLSFHPRKVITTGEGGMVLTDSDEIENAVRSLRNHGLAPVGEDARAGCREAGYNHRITDLQAAVGIIQLGKLEQIIAQRRRLANRYEEAISQITSLRLPKQSEGAEPNYQSFAVETADDSVDREAVLAFMNGRDIACGPGIYPIHLQPAYAEEHREDRLPETLRAARRSFFLPLYPGMTDDEQAYVIDSLKEALSKPPAAKEK